MKPFVNLFVSYVVKQRRDGNKVKKWKMLLAVTTLTFGLAACNETATPANKNVKETSEMTLEEVYNKSMAVSEELKSVSAKVDLAQKMHIPSEEMNVDISTAMDMNLIIEPMQIYQKGTTSMKSEDGSMNETMDTEIYFNDTDLYMYEGTTQQWMKLPQEAMGDVMAQTNSANPANSLAEIEEYLKDFKFEQDDKNYILTLDASGDKFNDLVQAQIDETMQSMAQAGEDVQLDVKINSINYLIHIDKESFQTTKYDVIVDMDMEAEGESINMKQDLKTDFSNFNGVDKIEIPQEVIDNAVTI